MFGDLSSAESDKSQYRERTRSELVVWLSVFILTIIGSWPAIYNGQPFFFQDTTAYVRGVDAALARFLHFTTVWTEPSIPQLPSAAGHVVDSPLVLSGRSIYYGMTLYLGNLWNFWPVVLLQSFVTSISVVATLNTMLNFRLLHLTALLIPYLFTPLPFFISFLMPDVFAGLTILATANLLAFGPRLRWLGISLWGALLAAAVLFHTSHLLLAGILALGGLAFLTSRRRGHLPSFVAIALAVATGVLGDVAFSKGVEMTLGNPPVRPPFLMARVIADGPGRMYLARYCSEVRFTVCDYRNNLSDSADAFLWNPDKSQGGVFSAVDANTRRQLSREQMSFVMATFVAYPLDQMLASAENFGKQLLLLGIPTFNYSRLQMSTFDRRVPEPYLGILRESRAAHGQIPDKLVRVLTIITSGLSVVVLAFLLSKRAVHPDMLVLVVAIVAGVLLNSAICAALSTPHDRYQSRTIWLLPLALVLAVTSHTSRRQSSNSVPAGFGVAQRVF
jgi:hypothetical protein